MDNGTLRDHLADVINERNELLRKIEQLEAQIYKQGLQLGFMERRLAVTDDIVTRPEQEMDFVEYLRLWASVDANDQAVRDLHKAADEIERLRTLLNNTLERENKDNARQLDIVRKVESDRNRWRATAEVLARELGKVEYADAEWRNQEGLH